MPSSKPPLYALVPKNSHAHCRRKLMQLNPTAAPAASLDVTGEHSQTMLPRRDILASMGVAAAALTGLGIGCEVLGRPQHSSPVTPPNESLSPQALGWDPKASQYILPPLPYKPEALEPHIDRQTMELHHGKHHQG